MSHQPLSHWFNELQIPEWYTGFGVPPERSSTSVTQTPTAPLSRPAQPTLLPRTGRRINFIQLLRNEEEKKKEKENEQIQKIYNEPQRTLKCDNDLLSRIKNHMMCQICGDFLAIYFVTCCKRTILCERCYKINTLKNGDRKCAVCNSCPIQYFRSLDMVNFLC